MGDDKAVRMLDCTLRDGGYYNDWDFNAEVVDAYLGAMADANIDYVELGLRQFKNEFNPNATLGLGDPLEYNFTNYVDWIGFFGQAEYSTGNINAFGMAGLTSVKYKHWNHFRKYENHTHIPGSSAKDGTSADWVEGVGTTEGGNAGELYVESDPISTFQIKGGVMYDAGSIMNFLNVIPLIGKIFSRDKLAYKYFINSVNEFYPKKTFINKLKKCGFKSCKHESLTFGLTSIYTAIKK